MNLFLKSNEILSRYYYHIVNEFLRWLCVWANLDFVNLYKNQVKLNSSCPVSETRHTHVHFLIDLKCKPRQYRSRMDGVLWLQWNKYSCVLKSNMNDFYAVFSAFFPQRKSSTENTFYGPKSSSKMSIFIEKLKLKFYSILFEIVTWLFYQRLSLTIHSSWLLLCHNFLFCQCKIWIIPFHFYSLFLFAFRSCCYFQVVQQKIQFKM